MGIDRRQWTARAPGPTGLRARIEQVAELVEPVELPPPSEEPEADAPIDLALQEVEEPAPAPAAPQPGSGILADVPHWRTNPAAFASRLDASAEADPDPAAWDEDAGEPADPFVDDA